MSSGAPQLQTDFELVTELLEQYPSIKLIQTEGEPPQSYDLEFNIKGYKSDPDDTAVPDNVHQVRIALPFGYPHFPPTAKPLTPIFHPDIDPDAIRIADFWEKSKSLPELIIHIGNMICGAIYSSEEPFNQRALDWYEERKSWMPFDILEPQESGEKGSDDIEFDITEDSETVGESEGIAEIDLGFDSLQDEEDDLDDDFSFQLDEVDDLVDQGGDPEQEELQPADIPADSGELEGLGDLPQEETPADEPALDDVGLDSIELGDLEGLDDETTDDTFSLDSEPAPDESENIELGDLDGLKEDDSSESFSLDGEGSSDLDALSFEAEAPVETEGTVSDREDAQQVAEKETAENGDGLDDIGLQLDDDSSSGTYSSEAQSIRPLIEKKEIFAAKKVLAEITDPSTVPDLKELELTISSAISEAEEMYKKADKLEQKGELEKAGLLLDLVANIATDYPGLEFARNRIRETKVTGDQEKAEAVREEREQVRKARKSGVKIPYKSIAAVLIVAGIGAAGFSLYSKDSRNVDIARSNFNTAEQFLKKKDFKQAKIAFTEAESALNNVAFLQKSWKQDLQQQIETTVNSQAFKEGLQGRVLHDGQYVTIEASKAIDAFSKQFKLAEQTHQAGNIEQAIALYEKSIEYAEKAGLQDQTQNIRQTIINLNLQQTLDLARKAEEDKEWKEAADTYKKALELSSNLARPEEQADISQRLAAAAFRHELDASKRAFTASEWQKTIEMLQRAQKILDENPKIASEGEKKELAKLLVNSRLYQILSAAKKAFEQRVWDLAIHNYRGAIDLLEKNVEILGKKEVNESRKTIEKTILMTQIAREQHLTSMAVSNDDLETTLKHYEAIVSLIDKSSFQNDEVLKKILENARTQTVDVKKELTINRRADWLTDNYEKIFRENYPSARSSELLSPKVSFIKREGNTMLFNMSCVEKKQGRTFRLELNYQYDLDKNSWKLYSGRL